MKSVQQHIQDGTYQPCRHADRGTTLEKIKGVACPSTIKNKDVKKLWKQVVDELCKNELVTVIDIPELEFGFYSYERAMECRAKLETFKDAPEYFASLKFHEKDIVAEYRKFMRDWEHVMYKFGMTPVEASKVRGNVKTNEDEAASDFIKALMGNG